MSRETEILEGVPLFAQVPAPALAALAARLRRRRLPAGTPVVYKGDPAGALYLIAAGRVKVHEATTRGDEVILEVRGPGEFFGEMSLLDGRPRSADVSTLEPSELLLLEGDALRETLAGQPAVAWTLLRTLSLRLRDQNDRASILMTRDVAGRVADRLLGLGDVPVFEGVHLAVLFADDGQDGDGRGGGTVGGGGGAGLARPPQAEAAEGEQKGEALHGDGSPRVLRQHRTRCKNRANSVCLRAEED